jgi:MoxR-like ATPase
MSLGPSLSVYLHAMLPHEEYHRSCIAVRNYRARRRGKSRRQTDDRRLSEPDNLSFGGIRDAGGLRDMERRHKPLLANGRPTAGTPDRDERGRAALHLADDAERPEVVHNPPLTIADVAEFAERLRANTRAAVHLAPAVLDVVLATLLADGHLLIEDHPGMGKTQLARALAGSLATRFSRVQATVDLLPSDIVGASIWRPEVSNLVFRPGPVFAHVVLVDELNRATPKTQSGLLEAMQERQVTVDGNTHELPSPFIVIATQNPSAAYDGTFALPPAQLDRFLARISLGYPDTEQEVALLSGDVSDVAPVSTANELRSAQEAVRMVHTSEALVRYVVALLAATRQHPMVEVGASPRAGLLLLSAARARAAIDGRGFAVPDDVQAIALHVLGHRLQLTESAPADPVQSVVAEVIAAVPAR